jgi:hypothetical protein
VDQFKNDKKLCDETLKFTLAYNLCITTAVHTLQDNLAACIPNGT